MRGIKGAWLPQIRSHGMSLAQKPLRKTPTILRAALFEGGCSCFLRDIKDFLGVRIFGSSGHRGGKSGQAGGVGGSAWRVAGNIQSFCHYGFAGLPPVRVCRPPVPGFDKGADMGSGLSEASRLRSM